MARQRPRTGQELAQALEQAHHHFDEAARLAAHGDIHASLAAGATGVGLAAEAAQLEQDDAFTGETEEVLTIDGVRVRTNPAGPSDETLAIDASSARRPVPGTSPRVVADYALELLREPRPLRPVDRYVFGRDGGAR
ncbi:MAG: hypothetical protein QJR09_12025 [Micrococcus sp.]|nr:hypothetical protein [Micrococcus sp.]